MLETTNHNGSNHPVAWMLPMIGFCFYCEHYLVDEFPYMSTWWLADSRKNRSRHKTIIVIPINSGAKYVVL